MQQTGHILPAINGLLKRYLIYLIWVIVPVLFGANPLQAQTADPVQSIRDLKHGVLLVRIPTSRAKIDTLKAMIARSDNASKERLQRLFDNTVRERDTLFASYTRAFRDAYRFSDAGYYFDYEGHDMHSAHFYKMSGDPLSIEELSQKPVFYLYFERTGESQIDALVIRNAAGIEIPSPFPNRFIQGGFNFLFVKIADKKFPAWRVTKINKKLFKYWKEAGPNE
jgi:hypothetical protein